MVVTVRARANVVISGEAGRYFKDLSSAEAGKQRVLYFSHKVIVQIL